MKQSPSFGRRHYADCIGRTHCTEVCSFQWVHSNVDIWIWTITDHLRAGANLFADVKHWGLVTLALANDDSAAHWNGLHAFSHSLNSQFVRVFSSPLTHRTRGGNRCCFTDAQN